jgi:hypothetical protein
VAEYCVLFLLSAGPSRGPELCMETVKLTVAPSRNSHYVLMAPLELDGSKHTPLDAPRPLRATFLPYPEEGMKCLETPVLGRKSDMFVEISHELLKHAIHSQSCVTLIPGEILTLFLLPFKV